MAARQHRPLGPGDITIGEWVGPTHPGQIAVIPLFEDLPSMLGAAKIVEEYLAVKDIADQRVFLAKSDTAMNYGLAAAALTNKIALRDFDELAKLRGVRLHPIMGTGSAPFRGGLSPANIRRVGAEYPSVATFTIQSAFKHDHPYEETREAIAWLRQRTPGPALEIDRDRALALCDRYSPAYRARVVDLAPAINEMARFVPARRARKLHVGLFGYARAMEGVTLPRAISFTCGSIRWACRRSCSATMRCPHKISPSCVRHIRPLNTRWLPPCAIVTRTDR